MNAPRGAPDSACLSGMVLVSWLSWGFGFSVSLKASAEALARAGLIPGLESLLPAHAVGASVHLPTDAELR